MNQYTTENRKPLVDSAPLFASVWLALFNSLRESYAEQRVENLSDQQEPLPGKDTDPASSLKHDQ